MNSLEVSEYETALSFASDDLSLISGEPKQDQELEEVQQLDPEVHMYLECFRKIRLLVQPVFSRDSMLYYLLTILGYLIMLDLCCDLVLDSLHILFKLVWRVAMVFFIVDLVYYLNTLNLDDMDINFFDIVPPFGNMRALSLNIEGMWH
ncbi:hypothetical protein KR018_012444 [Drosophila ironensis]|nr:hypothetical protein KR018_012444 [Drosophila ironensis]